MKATYRISEQDYVDAMKLFAKLTPRIVIIYSLAVLSLATIAVFGSFALRGAAIGGLIGGISVSLIGRYVVSPFLARRHYRKYKAIHEEFEIELVDDGVRFENQNGNSIVTWDKVHKWRQNEVFVLIYPMPRLFYIVPKSLVSQRFDIGALTDKLQQHVGAQE